MKTYLQTVSQKHQTVFAKLELPHFIEIAFAHSRHWVLSQVQETVLHKMHCTYLNIWGELFCKCNLTTDFKLCPLLEDQTT